MALACALPFDSAVEPLPTVDTTALALLTARPPTLTPLPAEPEPGRTADAPAATNTGQASQMPTPVPTRTLPATPTEMEAAIQPTAPASASPAATAAPAVPTTAPTAVPPALTPPVNRYNDVTGPVDPAGLGLQPVVSFVPNPVAMADPGDGSGRLFIASQDGRVHVLQNGALLPQPFLDLSPQAADPFEEQGFLGLAFHPNYRQNGYVYVHYLTPDLANVVERYTVSAADPNRADPASRLAMLRVAGLDGKHNGGQLAFGPYDGDLYIGLGDGGGANDPNGWAQNLSVLRGKILRLDVDAGSPYAIPPENPFSGTDGSAREVWAFGFRNPWRFAFDRARGDLWIADVGQENNEEINFQEAFHGAGLNYGWNLMEGLSCHLGFPCEGRADLITPLQYYFHQEGRCAVIGGFVYRGPSLPNLTGAYLYGDHCTGEIWAMRFNAAGDRFFETRLMDTNLLITSFGQDAAGELYVLSLTGEVHRIVGQ
jgi:glucose/arabinose dehydrogenase